MFPRGQWPCRWSHRAGLWAEKRPSRIMQCPAMRHLRALLRRIRDMCLNLRYSVITEQRTNHRPFFKPVTDGQTRDRCGQLFCEGVLNARLHVNPVGARTGLARVSKF